MEYIVLHMTPIESSRLPSELVSIIITILHVKRLIFFQKVRKPKLARSLDLNLDLFDSDAQKVVLPW